MIVRDTKNLFNSFAWAGVAISFLLIALPELWIWFEAIKHYVGFWEPNYTAETIFWFFVITMIAPIIPLVNFYGSKASNHILFVGLLIVAYFLFFTTVGAHFIPTLPLLEVVLLFSFTYIAVALNYFTSEKSGSSNTTIKNTVFKLFAFYAAFFIVLGLPEFFDSADSEPFGELKLLLVLVAIPVYIFFTIFALYAQHYAQPKTLLRHSRSVLYIHKHGNRR